MNQPLSQQDNELMLKALDALLVYMDSIADEKFETFKEVFYRVVEAKMELKSLEIDSNRDFLENCLAIDF